MRWLALALAGLSIAVFSTGLAWSAESDCILDNCADRRPPVSGPTSQPAQDESRPDRGGRGQFTRNEARPRGASRPGDFDFYVLSLSWSPGFCATGGDAKGRDQCRRGADIGFTVHGLWPQYDHGFPSDCRGRTTPPQDALAITDGLYPDRGLARYEWRRHGTCSGLSASEYFTAVKGARNAVTIPPPFKDPHGDQTLSPIEVEHDFLAANPRLHPGMVAAVCRNGTLNEMRVCFTKDLKDFQVCPEVVRGRCRDASLSVPAVR